VQWFDLGTNFELITFGVASTAILNLGILIFLNDKKSITNKTFLYFTIASFLWNLFNYLNFQFSTEITILWSLRLVLFFSIWYSFFLSQLFYVFPEKSITFSRKYFTLRLPIVILVAFLTLTPFVFPKIDELAPPGQVSKTAVAQGIYFYGLVIFYLIGDGVYRLIQKTWRASKETKNQYRFILLGSVMTFTAHIIFNFILPGIFLNVTFIPLGAVFTFPLITFTAYAILRHNFLNVKVIATEFLIFTLWIFVLVRALITDSFQERNLNLTLFVLLLFIGYSLIRSVRKEVAQREQLAIANKQLEKLNMEKSEFLSLASHQLKHSPTIVRNYASLIMEGSYGEIPQKVKEKIGNMVETAQEQLVIIDDFLNISRIEQGRMKYDFGPVPMDKLVNELSEEFKEIAVQTKTELTHEIKGAGPFTIRADYGKIKQVITNLINNAVEKYAKGKTVRVTLESLGEGKGIRLLVSDTGMGMSKETIARLFKRFSRAKEIGEKAQSREGSGLGLYIAREMVLAHGGRVWAESAGDGKGSVFFLELPSVPLENNTDTFQKDEEKTTLAV